jgi:hypothetical protein
LRFAFKRLIKHRNHFAFNFRYLSECAKFRIRQIFTVVFTFHINVTSSAEYKDSQKNLLQCYFGLISVKE